jgi:hypothetical protein
MIKKTVLVTATLLLGASGARAQSVTARVSATLRTLDRSRDLGAAVADLPANATLVVPANETFAANQPLIVGKNLSIECESRASSVLVAPPGQPLFVLHGRLSSFRIRGCTLRGNGPGSRLLVTPDFKAGHDELIGRFSIEDNVIEKFAGGALSFGRSTYMVDIQRNTFRKNVSSIAAKRYSELYVADNVFWYPGDAPQITLTGHSMTTLYRNGFEHGNSTTKRPDILITPPSDGNAGFIWIVNNKFGPEGEIPSRYKILVEDTHAPPRVAINVRIVNNDFSGAGAQQAAIGLRSPIASWQITGNFINSIGTFVDDDQPLTSSKLFVGNSLLDHNIVLPINAPFRLFRNGGRGFSLIAPPVGAAEIPSNNHPRANETVALQNRIAWSENLGAAGWTRHGVDVTAGQPDPFGTARAVLLSRKGRAPSESVTAPVGGGALVRRLVLKFNARQGSAHKLVVGLYDLDALQYIAQPTFQLASGWRPEPYKFVFAGIDPHHRYAIHFFPDGLGEATPATVHLFGVQLSDYDSDYVPTAGEPVTDTHSGNRWERAVHAAGGIDIGTGVAADGGGFKHVRAPTGDVPPNGTATVTLRFATPWRDPDFTVIGCTVVDPSGSLQTNGTITAATREAVSVRVHNSDAHGAHAGVLGCGFAHAR